MAPKKANTRIVGKTARPTAKVASTSAAKKSAAKAAEAEEVEPAEVAEEALSDRHKAALEATKRAIANLKAQGISKPTEAEAVAEAPTATHPADGRSDQVAPSPTKRARTASETASPLKDAEIEKVRDLVGRISNVNSLQRYAFASGYDALKMPLSKVSKDMVREAFTWLKAIERELSRPEPNLKSLEAMSKSFYAVVPLRECEGQDCISSKDILQSRLRIVSMLSDVEAAHVQWRLLLRAAEEAAAGGSDEQSLKSFDKLHSGLKCTLQPELSGSSVWNLVSEYLENSCSESSRILLKNVFKVHRPAEDAKWARFAQNPNRVLLWHGTRLTGCLSLLANGPRIPPKEAPDMGYTFGKGLYFWDTAGPAIALCDAESEGSDNHAMLLLAEVALGKTNTLTETDSHAEKLPQGVQSVMGQGVVTPNPAFDRRLQDGVRVPIGKMVRVRDVGQANSRQHNQFVVYNVAQVRMRYLVEVELVARS